MLTTVKETITMEINFKAEEESNLFKVREKLVLILQNLEKKDRKSSYKMSAIGGIREYSAKEIERMIDFLDDLPFVTKWELLDENE